RKTLRRRLGAKAGRVDDDGTATDDDPAGHFAGGFSCILDYGDTAERPFTGGEPRNRPLRIGIDQRGTASTKLPMHRQAACKRTLPAATFRGGHCDDRAHRLSVSSPKKRRIIRIKVIVFLRNCLLWGVGLDWGHPTWIGPRSIRLHWVPRSGRQVPRR